MLERPRLAASTNGRSASRAARGALAHFEPVRSRRQFRQGVLGLFPVVGLISSVVSNLCLKRSSTFSTPRKTCQRFRKTSH